MATGKDDSLAKDIAQDVFVSYWKARHEVASNEHAIRHYLYNSVRNASLNAIRHLKVVNSYLEKQEANPIEESNIMHAMIRSEVLTAIYDALESLPDSCKRISRMGYMEGLKNKDIARKLGISVNTVKTQKKRGLQLLRLRLDPKYFFFFF